MEGKRPIRKHGKANMVSWAVDYLSSSLTTDDASYSSPPYPHAPDCRACHFYLNWCQQRLSLSFEFFLSVCAQETVCEKMWCIFQRDFFPKMCQQVKADKLGLPCNQLGFSFVSQNKARKMHPVHSKFFSHVRPKDSYRGKVSMSSSMIGLPMQNKKPYQTNVF